MKSWKSIIVGIDFSDASCAALREAVRLAHWNQCSLHVAHVIPLDKQYEVPQESSTAISIVRDQVLSRLKELCLTETEFIYQIDYHILVGHPFRELCQLTHDIKADLLVLGTCQQVQSSHHPGVIATKCLRKAPAPVLLVRSTHENPFQNILVGVDFSGTSSKALRLASEIAFENQSHLHLVHVYEPALNLSDYSLCSPAGVESRAKERKQDELEKQLLDCKQDIHSQFPDLQVTTHFFNSRRASEALISFIEDHQISLSIIGTRGRTSLRSLLLGTTAERFIQQAPCSVLAVKPNSFSYPL